MTETVLVDLAENGQVPDQPRGWIGQPRQDAGEPRRPTVELDHAAGPGRNAF